MNQPRPMNFSRLLDYRPLEFLSHMSDQDRVDLFEQLFKQKPGEGVWEGILELFALWPENKLKVKYLDLAEQRLANWDDRLRFMWSSSAYLYEPEHLTPLARLARSIQIYRCEEQGSAQLLAIATSEYTRQLSCLSIVRSDISSRSWQAMAESPHLGKLQHLEVTRTVLAPGDIRRLFQSARFPRLQSLKLVDVGLKHQWLEGVRQSIPFDELRSIDFSRNTLGDEGVLLLAQAPWLRRIQRLALRHNYVTASAIRALLGSPYREVMGTLDLAENQVSETEKLALMRLASENNIQLIV